MRLPYLSMTALPSDRAAMLTRLTELLASDVPHGYLRASTPTVDRFLFFLNGQVHCAGELDGDRFVARGIAETVHGLKDMESASLYATDLGLLLCVAVPFRKAPAAQVPASLVDPDALLKSIRTTETDAVLVVRRRDARTLAFCRNGEPEAIYVAADEPFPSGGSIADRIVEYVFSDEGAGDVALDIYDQIRLKPAADAGRPLASHLETSRAREAPPATIFVKLGDREVFQYPMTQDEVIVGRGVDADLALDNLSVSRHHAKITRSGDRLTVTDLGGKNGLSVHGTKVEQVVLRPGEDVGIGKYTLVYSGAAHEGAAHTRQARRGPRMAALAETMLVEPAQGVPVIELDGNAHKLDKLLLNIGNGANAHVQIPGWFIAPIHAQIIRDEDGSYRLCHVAGRRKVRLNGEAITEAPLRVGDQFQVGRSRFVVRRAPPI